MREAVGPRLWPATLDNYQTSHPGQAALVAALRQYAADLPTRVTAGDGIVFFGAAGTGKDHLLVALAKLALRNHHIVVAFQHGLDFFSRLRDSFDSTVTSEGSVIHRLTSPEVLILSDPVPPHGRLTDWQASALLQAIDWRWRQQRPTWVSLNVVSGFDADQRMGVALVDRLRDGALCWHCDWPSYRRAKG